MRSSFRSQKVLHVRCIPATCMDYFVHLLRSDTSFVPIYLSNLEAHGTTSGGGGVNWGGGLVDYTTSLLLGISVPPAEVLAVPA